MNPEFWLVHFGALPVKEIRQSPAAARGSRRSAFLRMERCLLLKALSAKSRTRPQLGFSLIELLVVIAIVAAMAGLISIGVTRALAQQNEKQCLTNMIMIEAAKDEYLRDHIGEPIPGPGDRQLDAELAKYFRFGVPRCPDNKSADYVDWDNMNKAVSCSVHGQNSQRIAPRGTGSQQNSGGTP